MHDDASRDAADPTGEREAAVEAAMDALRRLLRRPDAIPALLQRLGGGSAPLRAGLAGVALVPLLETLKNLDGEAIARWIVDTGNPLASTGEARGGEPQGPIDEWLQRLVQLAVDAQLPAAGGGDGDDDGATGSAAAGGGTAGASSSAQPEEGGGFMRLLDRVSRACVESTLDWMDRS